MSKYDGGPAFPGEGSVIRGMGGVRSIERGMTLRDYFAGQALAGMIASPNHKMLQFHPHEDARWVYEIADAMLAERDK